MACNYINFAETSWQLPLCPITVTVAPLLPKHLMMWRCAFKCYIAQGYSTNTEPYATLMTATSKLARRITTWQLAIDTLQLLDLLIAEPENDIE